jgi:hypothetical protein
MSGDVLRTVIGPNVTLVMQEAAVRGRVRVCAARLRADAGPVAGQSVWWGWVVRGELFADYAPGIFYAIRTRYPRLGWSCAWASARILSRPLARWASFGVWRPGAWTLVPRTVAGCLVVEPPALRLERRLRAHV